MKKFSDFGIRPKDNEKIFDVPRVSIMDILNCEITVIAFQANIKTKHGDNRYVIKILHNNVECKFFTSSKKLEQMLDEVPQNGFPFTTIIKQQSFGLGCGKTFYFT